MWRACLALSRQRSVLTPLPLRPASSGPSATNVCWKCGATATVFTCRSCGAVQPASPKTNPFELLDTAVSFAVDPDALHARHRQLQRTLHPDHMHGRPSPEPDYARDQSALLNSALATLIDPLQRAQTLLRLRGIDALGEGTALLDANHLQALLEAREAVDEARSLTELREVQTQATQERKALLEKLAAAFAQDDMDAAQRHTIALQYCSKLLEAAAVKETALETSREL